MFAKLPKFSKDQDIGVFLSIYETTAEVNNWVTDKQKLQQLHNCFKGRLLNWVVTRKFEDWAKFKEELRDKLDIPVRDDIYFLNKLMGVKRKLFLNVSKYITKFDDVMTDREANFTNSNTGNTNNEITSPHDETFYLQLFIRNSSPADMRRFLNQRKPRSMKQAYKAAKEYEEDDSSDEDISSTDDDSENDNSDDDKSDSKKRSKKSKTKEKVKSSIVTPVTQDFQAALLCMMEQNNKILLMHQQANTNNTNTSPRNKGQCFNCNITDHFDRECPSPCKHCKSTEHRRYHCPLKPNKNNSQTPRAIEPTNATGPVLLIETSDVFCEEIQGDILVVKRTSDDARITRDNIIPKRLRSDTTRDNFSSCTEITSNTGLPSSSENETVKVAVPKSAIVTEVTPVVETFNNTTVDETHNTTVDETHNTTIDETHNTTVNETHNNTVDETHNTTVDETHYTTVVTDGKNEVPLIDKSPTTKTITDAFNGRKSQGVARVKTTVTTMIDTLRDKKVFELSYNDIIALSSKAHTEFRKPLENTKEENKPSIEDLLYQNILPEHIEKAGTHAPRIEGRLNGQRANLILDTGCTPCVINFKLVKELGLENQLREATTGQMMVGDGRKVKSRGIIDGISIEVLPGFILKTNAVCLELPENSYEFLMGRIAMARFGIGTDLGSDYWYLRDGIKFHNLDVLYTDPYAELKTEIVGEFGEEQCFLVSINNEENNFKVIEAKPVKEKMVKLLDQVRKNTLLNPGQQAQLIELLLQKQDAFGVGYKDLKQTSLVKFHVNTGDAKPIMKRPFQGMTYSELELLKKDLADMVESGVLIPAMHSKAESNNGGWAFQVMYVRKKDGTKRLVTMFQDLNKVTIRDPWPLPVIANVIESFHGASFFSGLDMLKGFHQIACEEEDIPKLTITTQFGNYSYCVLPFGVINGPSTFSRAIHLALQEFIPEFCIAYIDDCTVFSATFEDHLLHFEKVLDRLIEVKMTLNPDKCNLFQNKIEFLGFEISVNGVLPLKQKIDKVQLIPSPRNKTDIRAFVNMAGFYRRHIHYFSRFTIKMTDLLKKDKDFVWTNDHQEEFVNLKNALVNATQLRYPDPRLKYRVYCDACDVGISGALVQVDETGTEFPICFVSRKVNKVEYNWSIVDKELLALTYSLFKFRKYILDRRFEVLTDNRAVKYLFEKKEPNTRLQRWCLALQEYDFSIRHISSTSNKSDFFSRYPCAEEDLGGEEMLEQMYNMLVTEVQVNYENELQTIFNYLSNVDSEISKVMVTKSRFYVIQGTHLYRKVGGQNNRLVKIPHIAERGSVLKECHDGHGHFGQHSTWATIYHSYWWPGVYEEVKAFVRSCHACQLFAPSPLNRSPLQGKSVNVLNIFEQFSIDFVGPLPVSKSGSRYILVCMEMFTRWPIAVPTKKADAITAATFLYEQIFCMYGPITKILSDNGSHFRAELVKRLIDKVQSKHLLTTPYHPQCNGMVEKFNGTLLNALRKMACLKKDSWDTLIPTVLYAYRVRAHEAIGISPYELMYGVSPLPAVDDPLLKFARALGFERLIALPTKRQQIILKEQLAIKPLKKLDLFKVGSLVLKRQVFKEDKLASGWLNEVFCVVAAFNNNTYKLARKSNGVQLKNRINGIHLKPYFNREIKE